MSGSIEFVRELDENESNSLAERILGLDAAITNVGIISHVGFPLGGAIRKSYKNKVHKSKEDWENEARRAGTIMASVKADDKRLSTIQSIILIRKESKSLLLWIPQHAIIVAAVFEISVDGSVLSAKIRNMFGMD